MLSLGYFLHSSNKQTDSSKLRYLGILFGNLGVSNSSTILLSMRWALGLRYFQNLRMDNIFLALVPGEEFNDLWQWEIKEYISDRVMDFIDFKSVWAKFSSI